MRTSTKLGILAAALVGGFVTVGALSAQTSSEGRNGMMGMMMSMMGGQMNEQCGQMMGTGRKPNDQWRKDAPSPNGKG